MAKSEKTEFVLSIVSKNVGAVEAEKSLRKVGAAAEQTKGKMDSMSSSAGALAGSLKGWLGAAAIGVALKESLRQFAAYERSLNSISVLMRQMGIDAERQTPRVKNFVEALALGGGAAVEDSIKGFQKFLTVLGDVDAAMYATKLASNIAEGGLGNYQAAAQALAGVIQGELGAAKTQLNIDVRKTDGTLKTAAEVVREISDLYGEAAGNIKDTTSTLARAEAHWDYLTRVVGGAVASVFNAVYESVADLPILFKTIPEQASVAFHTVFGYIKGAGAALAAMFDFKRIAFEGTKFIEDAFDNAAKIEFDKAKASATVLRDKYNAFHAERNKDEIAALEKGKEKLIAFATKATLERLKKEQDAEDKARTEREEKIADAEAKALDALLEARLRATAQGSEVARDLELEILREQYDRMISEYEKIGADTTALVQTYAAERAEIERAYSTFWIEQEQERVAKAREFADARLQVAEDEAARLEEIEARVRDERRALMQEQLASDSGLTIAERENLSKELLKVETEERLRNSRSAEEKFLILRQYDAKLLTIEKASARTRIAMTEQIAAAAMEIGAALFGDNKALAIANAIINTALGVTRAIAEVPYPANFIVAAAVLAKGVKEIQTIKKTEPGGGGGGGKGTFDDPTNDQMAFLGGRKSVADFIRLTNEGIASGARLALDEARAGLSSTPTPTPTAEAPITINGNVYGGPEGLQALGREIRRASRLDAPRIAR